MLKYFPLLYKICAVLFTPALILVSAVFALKVKNSKAFADKNKVEYEDTPDGDLSDAPKKAVVMPLIPKAITPLGLVAFLSAFGLSGLFNHSAGTVKEVSVLISVCFGVCACVSAALIEYAMKLKYDKSIIFVPRSIGLKGKVFTDIPARQKGTGSIRLIMNGKLTQIKALTGDETTLTKGTDIKVVYADSDKVVIVERYVKGQDDETTFDAAAFFGQNQK